MAQADHPSSSFPTRSEANVHAKDVIGLTLGARLDQVELEREGEK
jgi:hypothetical protein